MRFAKHLPKVNRQSVLIGGILSIVSFTVLVAGSMSLAIFPNPWQGPLQRAYLRFIPGDKSGSLVLFQSLASLSESKSLLFTSTMSAQLLTSGKEIGQVSFSTTAPLQWSGVANLTEQVFHQDLQFAGELRMPGNSVKTEAEVKLTDQNLYFKLNSIPNQLGLNLNQAMGQWYLTPLTASDSATTKLTAGSQQKLTQSFAELWRQATVGRATLQMHQGQSVYVLQVLLPKTAMQAYLRQVFQVESQTRPDQKPEITHAWQNWLVTVSAPLSDLHGELWVDRQSLRPVQFEGAIVYLNTVPKKTDNRVGLISALSSINQVNLNFKIALSKYNESFPFTEPSDALPASQIFSEALGKLQSGTAQSGVGTTELPTLTPYQQLQLQKLNSISPAQKQHFLDQLDKNGPLSTGSASQP